MAFFNRVKRQNWDILTDFFFLASKQ